MRKHEWETLEGIARLSARLVEALERIADSLDTKKTSQPIAIEEKLKVKRTKKTKDEIPKESIK